MHQFNMRIEPIITAAAVAAAVEEEEELHQILLTISIVSTPSRRIEESREKTMNFLSNF